MCVFSLRIAESFAGTQPVMTPEERYTSVAIPLYNDTVYTYSYSQTRRT